jgi:hypothetical protein
MLAGSGGGGVAAATGETTKLRSMTAKSRTTTRLTRSMLHPPGTVKSALGGTVHQHDSSRNPLLEDDLCRHREHRDLGLVSLTIARWPLQHGQLRHRGLLPTPLNGTPLTDLPA